MTSINGPSLFSKIPDEINLRILLFLDYRSTGAMACTCQLFKRLGEDALLWKTKTENEFGTRIVSGIKHEGTTWKQTYKALKNAKRIHLQTTQGCLFFYPKPIFGYPLYRDTPPLFGFAIFNEHMHLYFIKGPNPLDGKVTLFGSRDDSYQEIITETDDTEAGDEGDYLDEIEDEI